jgi:hypothetical protein
MKRAEKSTTVNRNLDKLISKLSANEILNTQEMISVKAGEGEGDGGGVIIIIPKPGKS